MSFWAPFPEIRRELDRVQRVIDQEVAEPGGIISSGLGDLAGRESKLLRPGFTILAARISNDGRDVEERVVHLAAAIEMLHMASLIHDDIVDDAEMRRGRKALHVTHGCRAAVLLGDYLFARCIGIMAEHARSRDVRVPGTTVAHIVSSAISEVNSHDRFDLSRRRYLHRIVGKTAVLFSLSFHLGAVEGRSGDLPQQGDPVVEALRRTGYNIGVGFQIIDDLLDISGDPSTTGKPRGTDLRSGIMTLPLILALRRSETPDLANLISKVRRGRGRVDTVLDKIRRYVEASGAARETRALAERYTRRADRELRRLPEGPDRHILGAVTARLLDRQT